MAGRQPYSQEFNGQAVFAFKLGGDALYHTGPRANPAYVTGSQEAPSPPPIATWRRPVGNTAPGIVPDNEIWIARSTGNDNSAPDSNTTGSMVPSVRTIPVGTTVTFRNPGMETFPSAPNVLEHCATQFFEGEFNFRLQPGETAEHTFTREGEYFYNDCTDPRPVGKIVVTLDAQDQPGALSFSEDNLDLRSETGIFTEVVGDISATLVVPDGFMLYSPESIVLETPLTSQLFQAKTAVMSDDSSVLMVTFDKAEVDNNIPAGTSVPLKVTANFLHDGVQKKLSSTAVVTVTK
jgi:plastocyanin